MNAFACGLGFFSDHPIRAIIGSNRGKNGQQTSERGKKLTAVSAKIAAALKASMLANIVETPSRSSDTKRGLILKGLRTFFMNGTYSGKLSESRPTNGRSRR